MRKKDHRQARTKRGDATVESKAGLEWHGKRLAERHNQFTERIPSFDAFDLAIVVELSNVRQRQLE